ncbi:hypothetical protein Sjap_005803 [Stephania japonica]|uniref:Uncharacterized protein n=1 Tax=Stephania japonica TaxID=461633 RepID=A0AAP0PLG5_9MAGN
MIPNIGRIGRGTLSLLSDACNRQTLDAALHFKCTLRDNVSLDDAFEMADQVIAFLSGYEDTYQTTVTSSESEEELYPPSMFVNTAVVENNHLWSPILEPPFKHLCM